MSSGESQDQFGTAGQWPGAQSYQGQPPPPPYGPPGSYPPPQYGGPGPYVRYGRATNSLAIAALCCGIGQVVAGPLAAIAAIVLGVLSLNQIKQTGEDGRGMAIAGLVIGIAGLVLSAVVIIIFIGIIAHMGSAPPS